MFIVQVPDFITRASYDLCQRQNFGKRGDGSDGNRMHQLVGAICQNSILYAYGQPLMKESQGPDPGYDIIIANQRVDIKSTKINKMVQSYHTHAVPESQIHFDTEIYLFCALDVDHMLLTVTGWLEKYDFLFKSNINKKGAITTTPNGKQFVNRHTTYEVKVNDLNSDAADFQELAYEIEQQAICYG